MCLILAKMVWHDATSTMPPVRADGGIACYGRTAALLGYCNQPPTHTTLTSMGRVETHSYPPNNTQTMVLTSSFIHQAITAALYNIVCQICIVMWEICIYFSTTAEPQCYTIPVRGVFLHNIRCDVLPVFRAPPLQSSTTIFHSDSNSSSNHQHH